MIGQFAELTAETRLMKTVRQACVTLFCTWAVFAGISGYRAIVQVYSIDLRAPDTLRAGSAVGLEIKTSGRNFTTASLLVIQGARSETLASRVIRDNSFGYVVGSPSLNPMPVRDSVVAHVPAALLERFAPGAATIRAIGLGRSQWMRVPPPTIRERAIILK